MNKNCPHCAKEISSQAIRCRYCRKLLVPSGKNRFSFFSGVILKIKKWNSSAPLDFELRWGLPSVLFLWFLVFSGAWAIEYTGLVSKGLDYFRGHYFIFTKEPLLQQVVYVSLDSFVLKTAAVLAVLGLLAAKKENLSTLAFSWPRKGSCTRFTLLFFFFCVTVGWMESLDPLAADLPTALFFEDAAILGNLISVVAIMVVAPITEEIFFRGFMYPVFRKKGGLMGGTLMTAFLFALAHFPQLRHEPQFLAILFVGGAWITLARALSGSTSYAILLHMIYNSTLVAIGFLRHGLV